MPRYHVTILGKDYDAIADLVRKYHVAVVRQTAHKLDRGGYTVDAVADPALIHTLEANGYQVQQHEDIDEAGKAGLREVGQGNRYERPTPKPR